MSSYPAAEALGSRRLLLKYTPAELKKMAGTYLPINMKRDRRGALVRATNFVTGSELVGDVIGLFASSDTLYSALQSGTLRNLKTNKIYVLKYHARGVVTYCSETGEHTDYAFGTGGAHAIRGETLTYLPGLGKATSGAIFRERLFLALGSTITYTAPLSTDTVELSEEDTGKISLSEVGGEILALIPHEDRLLVFRTHEILKLRADANDLNFSFSKVNFDGGEIEAGSVQKCGKYVVFRTERGFYTFDGATCEKAQLGDETVTFPHHGMSAAHAGIYYTAAKYDSSECLLAYDPESKEFFVMGGIVSMLAGSEKGMWFVTDNYLTEVGKEGYSIYNFAGFCSEIDLTEKAAKYVLEGVSVAGKGSFTLTLEVGSGRSKSYKIEAFEPAKLRHTLPLGRVRISLHSFDEDATIREVILHLREVGA